MESAAGSRFRGYRWVTNLRDLRRASRGRPSRRRRAIILLRWNDCPDLPRPRPQVPVPAPEGRFYYVDVGVEALTLRRGVRRRGVARPGARQHDADRRGSMTKEHQWQFDIFVRCDLFGRASDVERRLHEGVRAASVGPG